MPTIRYKIDKDEMVRRGFINKQEESIMMNSFLRGFGAQSEELKKAWEENKVIGVDVSEELNDIFKVYKDSEAHLLRSEKLSLDTLTTFMRSYLEIRDEREKISHKLSELNLKLASARPVQENDEDEEGE